MKQSYSYIKSYALISILSLSSYNLSASESTSIQEDSGNNWILIDNFESERSLKTWTKADTKNDTDPKIENPQVTIRESEVVDSDIGTTTNGYLLKKPAAEGVVGNRKALTYKTLPQPVPVGDTYTFYTRINVESFPNNHAFGISNLDGKNIEIKGYDGFEPTLRVTDKAESSGFKNDGALMVKVEGGTGYANIRNTEKQKSAEPLTPGVWYEIWYVVNNASKASGGQSYDVYIKGGEFLKQTKAYTSAVFRMKRELPLTHFLMNCNTGPKKQPYGNGGLKYDDLYMSKGVNLTLPL